MKRLTEEYSNQNSRLGLLMTSLIDDDKMRKVVGEWCVTLIGGGSVDEEDEAISCQFIAFNSKFQVLMFFCI
jgi:hypothetical protein